MKNNRTFLEKLLNGAEVEWKTLDEISSIYGGLTGKGKADFENGNALYVPYKNIFNNIEVDFNNLEAVNVSDDERQYTIKYGDVLFTGSSETAEEAGMSSAVTTKTEQKIYLNSFSFGLRFNDDVELLPEFSKFLFRTLSIRKEIVKSASGVTRFNISKARFKKIKIPIPPLSVQTEIVRILDALTALTSELTSELTLRRKQYEYYREKLLSHNDSENSSQQKVDKDKLFSTSNIQWLHLNEIYKFQYGIGNKIPTIGGEYPVYGSNGIVGTHNEYNSENAPVIGHIGAYAGIVNWAEGKHFVTYNGIICNKINDNVNSRYAYYLLLSQNFIDKANKASQPFISYDILNKCIVPVPPPEEQQRIVSILDKFETLTNSITEGLPLAIEQSQKRYEYYRELLLNFPGRE